MDKIFVKPSNVNLADEDGRIQLVQVDKVELREDGRFRLVLVKGVKFRRYTDERDRSVPEDPADV